MTRVLTKNFSLAGALFAVIVGGVVVEAAAAPSSDKVDPLAASPLGNKAEAQERLLKRPDEDRPADQLKVSLFGRPLTIGGQWELQTRFDADTRLGSPRQDPNPLLFNDPRRQRLPPKDDELAVDQRAELELFYQPFDDLFFYVEGKFFYATVPYSELGVQTDEFFAERGESWIYLADILDSPFSVQIGRQRLNESREWWWDEDLDAARLHFDQGNLHSEVAAAQEVLQLGNRLDRIDVRSKDVFRIFSLTSWSWADSQYLDLLVLHARDHSATQKVGTVVRREFEDPIDASLTWFGVRTRGRIKNKASRLYYWGQIAFLRGHENFVNYDTDPPSGLRFAADINRHRVSGMAADLGLTWSTDQLPGQPSFTVGYAYGSGRFAKKRRGDTSFRQSGLNDNNGRFRGVDRFRYYGELLDPNLSNLHIATAAIGLRLLRSSSVEFVYHAYDQVETVGFLHSTALRRSPTGGDSFIGHEFDVVVGIEEWKNVQIELIGGVFRAGSAFGPAEGDTAYLGALEIQFNF